MTKALLIVCCLTGLLCTGYSQDNKYLEPADSDPEATAILEKIERHLLTQNPVAIDFSLSLQYPGEDVIEYTGTVEQQQDMFYLDMGMIRIISNGHLRWVYDREANEVNIYDAEAEGPQTPLEFLEVYKEGNYVYHLDGEGQEDSESVQYIEFKPVDRASDYSKIRLTVSDKTFMPRRIELFEKDGSRTNMQLLHIRDAVRLPAAHFTFNQSEYPGVRVEDLRID